MSATLASTKTELALTQDRLEIREAEFADLDARHMAALSDLDTKRITISDLGTRLGLQTDRCNDFERSLADRRRELSEERERLAELAQALLAEQERAAALESRIEALEGERDGEVGGGGRSHGPPSDALRRRRHATALLRRACEDDRVA